MQELSLHILDLIQNSVEAGAKKITLVIKDAPEEDELSIVVTDDGCGMNAEQCANVTSPFCTSRQTRRVGLGLAFLEMAVTQCGGKLRIESSPGYGTEVMAIFSHSHPDRQPMGDIAGTIVSALMGETEVTFEYLHIYKNKKLKISSLKFAEFLGIAFRFDRPEHLSLLEENIREQLQTIYGGESS
ncbi:MAG: ATP-binding protein [Clostridium sp.]|nr:ATP-binding protein [Clostridium sp.]